MKNILPVIVTCTALVLFSIGAQAQSRHMEKRGPNSTNEQYSNNNSNDQYAQNNAPYNRDEQYGQNRQQDNGNINYDQKQYNGYDKAYGRGNNYNRYDRSDRYKRFAKAKRFNDRRGRGRSFGNRGNSCSSYGNGRY